MYILDAVEVIFMFLQGDSSVSSENTEEAIMALKRANISPEDLRLIMVSRFSCTIGQSHRISKEIKKLLVYNDSLIDRKFHAQLVFASEFMRWYI